MNNREDDFVSRLGIELRKLREQKNLTQLDLSVLTNIPRRQIGRIERGEVNTTVTTLKVIADAMEMPLGNLIIFE